MKRFMVFIVILSLVCGAKLIEIKLRKDEIRSVKCESFH